MDTRPIKPPKGNRKRAIGRAAVESVVEVAPGGSLLTKILAVTHPPIDQVERQQWEVDMTHRSNEQDEIIQRLVGAHVRIGLNFRQANRAQQLSFFRGGMITALEAIARDGLMPETENELASKFASTADDVEELLRGLDAALNSMSDDPRNREFVYTLHETVFGAFGKGSIRNDIQRLLRSGRLSVEFQKEQAKRICEDIDRFNANLVRLSSYAVASGDL